MKIYTRTGDDGSTGLLGAGRVFKSDPRVEAYGTVDELNASIGVARTLDPEAWVTVELGIIQSQLFQLGAELATLDDTALDALQRLGEPDVSRLEGWIDRFMLELPPLKNFILPGGSPLGAHLHLTRTVCRRAERRLVALQREQTIESVLIRYLNRLGDLLFVWARWCNLKAGVADQEWSRGRTAK